MNKTHDLAMPPQDLATLLTSLAGQLRRDALAVTGLAHQEGDGGMTKRACWRSSPGAWRERRCCSTRSGPGCAIRAR